MKSSIFFLTILSILLINSSSITNQSQSDSPTGTYFMHGTIIENKYSFGTAESELLSSDTTTISFVTDIQMVEEKQDTVQFFGLVGANADRYHSLPVVCENPNYCGYAAFELGAFQFNYMTPGGYYTGTGQLEGKMLTINTTFKDRGIGIEYEIQGRKIDEGEL